jgi:TolA-binding protein
MTNGDSNVVEGRGTKTLSPEAKPFTLTISSSLPTSYRRRTTGDVMGSTSKTSFPPTQAVRREQTEAYHMSGATVPLAPRPQWGASRVPRSEEKRLETVPSMRTPPHSNDEKGALVKESKWQQVCHDHELHEHLRREVERLEKQLEDDRLEFEAVGRPQADVEALKEERVELVRMNRSQANCIRELQDEVKKLKTKPERLQSMYERYAKDYQDKLDEAETRATTLENNLKEFKC